MSWVFLVSVLVVAVAGAVVLPRRRQQQSPGFPWFWVLLPVAMLALVSAVGVLISRFAGVDTPDNDKVGLSMPYPEFNQSVQFLSNEQFLRLGGPIDPVVYIWFFPVLGIICTIASVVAWKKGRM